jgi:Carboxypeptidase regulatory-like domain
MRKAFHLAALALLMTGTAFCATHPTPAIPQITVELPQRTVSTTIAGKITDSTGAPVGETLVEIVDTQTHTPVASQIASESGEFSFSNLPIGHHYKLRATQHNFDPLEIPLNITKYARTRHLKIELKVAT